MKKKQQNGMCTQSDLSLRCVLYGKLKTTPFFMQTADSDQTRRTYHFFGFVSMRLSYYIHMYVLSVSVFRLI